MSVPATPDSSPADRRRAAAEAGHRRDLATARQATTDADPRVRQLGLSALERMHRLDDGRLAASLADADFGVRRRAAELTATHPRTPVAPALADTDARVVEMAAWAVGERPFDEADHAQLIDIADNHTDALCREAAVAALGALGRPEGLTAIIAALEDVATVRRRAVVALAPFEGPDVEAALTRAAQDRDWQTRQSAEDLSEPQT